jgi:tetratricopeptide (TPR) repeat protein
MPLVRREARKALVIDPSLPEGHAILGLVAAVYEYDWPAAERHFAAAMACDPLPSAVRRFYALYYLLPVGRSGEAADECARALEDDPLNLLGRLRLAQCLRAAGRDAEATKELRRVLALDQDLWFTHFILGLETVLQGDVPRALPHAEKAYELAPWSPVARALLAAALTLEGTTARAQSLLDTLKAGEVYGAPLALATYHLVCSDLEATADWTERAIEERHPAIFFFLHAHARTLQCSTRWPALAGALNLPSAEP